MHTFDRGFEWHPAKKSRRGLLLAGITIRLDDDVLEWFRTRVREAGSGDYQTLINDALRTYVEDAEEPAEKLLRRVIREELERHEAG